VADGAGKAVDHRFLIFVDMAVAVGNALLVHMHMFVAIQGKPPFLSTYHTSFRPSLQALWGDKFL
jgi:hypothetical protein